MAGHCPWKTILFTGVLAVISGRNVQATPGRVGCFYDLQLCERNELCYNDSLFGTCVSQLSDAVNYNDLEPEALNEAARILQYLIETGYKWQDSYTQCVVGKYLQSVVSQQRYDPEVCEYLKAILDVIDQNRASSALLNGGPTDQQSTGIAAAAPFDGPVTHGEFLSKSDGKEDFDAVPSGSQPLQPPQPAQMNVDDPSAYAALQQYMRNYQESLLQAQQSDPSQSADVSLVEKKSGSSLEQVSTIQPAVEVSTVSTTTTPTTQVTTEVTSNQTASPDQQAAEDAEAMQRLFALVNSFPPSDDQMAQMALVQQSPELTAVPMSRFDESQPNIIPVFGRPIQSGGPGPMQFDDMNGIQFVPDFSAPPPPGMLNPMEQMMLAQQMYGPQGPPMGDPRGFQGPLMDPRMMQMQMPFGPQQQPSMADQIMLAQQMQMMGIPPQGPVMDARALMGSGFGMDPAMMGMQPGPGPMDQMPFVGMPNKRGPPPQMMNPVDQMIYAQQIQQMLASQYPPQLQNGPPMMSGPFSQGMPDPNMMMMLGRQPPPYGFFPQGPPPQMMQNGPPPFLRDQFGQQDQWAPMPMMLPEGFPVIESQPALEPSNNSSGQSSDEMIRQLFAERGEQSGEASNGASEPASQSKKDQEYKSLLPSDENLQTEVVEDVTVKVVKGSFPDGPDDNTGLETNTVVNDGQKSEDQDENYVFIMTSPQLNFDEARYLLNWLAAVMSLPSQTFYDISVNDDLVTFRINPAFQNLNATYIAQSLGDDELRRALRQANGLEIVRAGVGKYALMETSGQILPEMRFQQTAVVQNEPIAEIAKKYDVVDSTYAFIDVKESQLTYDKARRILNWLAVKLQVPQTVFSNLHIEGNQLVFRVSPYFNKINATSVSLQLADPVIISELKDQFGVTIDKTGIGDEVQVVKADNKQQQILLIGLILVACIAAILIILGIVYLVRRNMLMKMKLHGLGGDVESSKEYEELCRQRMASKNLESLSAGIGASPDKIATDRTTHSSTSSWSEEPAPSNMDITTGHMVLSYMEDHLKHKERLNEEWASLCTYEADPSRTEAGSQKENLIKNRYPDVLPYDHTRVRLNPEANETKSDYINANFITDADPKNPSYIATQGPLPETVSDFWQMIWEQNSTVIAMLTRLRENDQDMCHVYWPKEGSEVYNNFEVHLVSEHIWCDDYLVRNFYLKNLQNHETRTVTQFHYLNWPNLGVPSSLKTFLEFRRKINKCYKGGSSPIAVVCSDGVDRTGAYCLIDLVLNRMAKGAKEIDIAATLEHLRDQRMDMVRTKDQFEFVLTAVAQEIQAILKSMPQK